MVSVVESVVPGPTSSKVSLSTSMDCRKLRCPVRDPDRPGDDPGDERRWSRRRRAPPGHELGCLGVPPAQLVTTTRAMAKRSMPIRIRPVADDGDEGHTDQHRRRGEVPSLLSEPSSTQAHGGQGQADDHEPGHRPAALTSDLPLVTTMNRATKTHGDQDAAERRRAMYHHLTGFWSRRITARRTGMAIDLGDDAGDQTVADLALGGMGEVELHRRVIGPGRAVLYPARSAPADRLRGGPRLDPGRRIWSVRGVRDIGPTAVRAGSGSRRPPVRPPPARHAGRQRPPGEHAGEEEADHREQGDQPQGAAEADRGGRRRSRPRWRPGPGETGRSWPTAVRRSVSEMKGIPLSICDGGLGRDRRAEWPGCR